jgi:hypothetical protein
MSSPRLRRSRVVLSDGRPMVPDMHVNLFADRRQNSQSVVITADGSFEFKGLAKGVYSASVKSYRAPRGHVDEVLRNRIDGQCMDLGGRSGR